jgi:ribosomal protein L12E/L44/L45/RPP1/RPP2
MGMSTQTIVFALNDENLKRMIREAAKDTARVFFAPPREKADEAAQDHADAGL